THVHHAPTRRPPEGVAGLFARRANTMTREVMCQGRASSILGAPGWNGCETSFSARATNEKPRHQSGLLRGILRRPARRKRTAMMQEHIA
ncbi:unnamed protein product, partial [Ectocarpus sp. 13 AM-2016]